MNLVSVIVPIYNLEKYISRCIESIINQTLKEIEIILVNDGSTDKSLEIIKEYGVRDSRIKIIDKNNSGISESRSIGLSKATGKYVLFIDGDDWIRKDTLEILYAEGEKELCDIVLYNGVWVYKDREINCNTYKKETNINIDPLKNLFLNNVLPGVVFKFIRRDFIIQNEIKFPPKLNYAEDFAITATLFFYKPKVSCINEYLYFYFQREDSLTGKYNSNILEINKAFTYIERILREEGIYSIYKYEFENAIYTHLFEYNVLGKDYSSYITKEIYKNYKEKNIKISRNYLIKEKIKDAKKILKVRILAYNINYSLGRLFDCFRIGIKSIFIRGGYEN